MTATTARPQPKGPYATTRRVGDVLYLSGQGSIDPTTGAAVLTDIGEQTRRTLANVETLLTAEGFAIGDLAQVTCYLTDIADLGPMNRAYADYIGDRSHPVRTAVQVADLPFGLSLEMTCIAHREPVAGA